jgi:hypothetical protein
MYRNVAGTGAEWWFACMVSETMRKEVLKSETAEVHRGQHANISCQNYKRQSRDKGRVYTMATQGAVKHYTLGLCFTTPWATLTLYRIASERSDFHTRFGCCLRYATVIRYATWSKNHSALEVIWKVIRYVPGSVNRPIWYASVQNQFWRVCLSIVAFICLFYNTLYLLFFSPYNHLQFLVKTNKENDNNNWLFAFERAELKEILYQFWIRAKRSNVWWSSFLIKQSYT